MKISIIAVPWLGALLLALPVMASPTLPNSAARDILSHPLIAREPSDGPIIAREPSDGPIIAREPSDGPIIARGESF
ncbi:hypothetical protein DTO013E5_10200 [Penicillium roqueforti]|uniref:uncharacterized protein n=1 Tax=Penicillium roqueforti TaxID=5082 RepID=UPI00190CEC5B|nr:uncharacterized protein LCP9604111_8358 [Penicillium roqueforti]KAF9241415.1 hypothetical protein LCP9604111_8358 [Penicillium roqueforti]KAI2670929.1 hypothetical protein CBS147355_9041 [Penicillium roqueforti]KAI2674590.1 hypothetical protein LCP963914a_8740 [Penicillium roqueforti]KAI2696423.1 hypothetical protein CBS147354_9911 [Penicillium roqueforti]KAI2709037.1 hypothetical protein CBS147318_9329 [Penicillium roqueforti]